MQRFYTQNEVVWAAIPIPNPEGFRDRDRDQTPHLLRIEKLRFYKPLSVGYRLNKER